MRWINYAAYGFSAWSFYRNPGSIFRFVVLAVIIVAIHEFGHFVVAIAVGHRVRELSIGVGKPILTTEVAGCHLRLRRVFFAGGHVVSLPKHRRWYKLRRSAVLLAGVTAQMLSAWILVTLGSSFLPGSWVTDFLIFNGLIAVANLLPIQRPSPTDGAQFITTLGMNASDIDRIVDGSDAAFDEFTLSEERSSGNVSDSLQTSYEAVMANPTDPGRHANYANALIFSGRYQEAAHHASLLQSLRTEDTTPTQQAFADNLSAMIFALLGDPINLAEARSRATSAHGHLNSPATADTLGSVLVQTGEPKRGLELLAQTPISGIGPLERFEHERFKTLGYLALGKAYDARKQYAVTSALCPVEHRERLDELLAPLGSLEAGVWLPRLQTGDVPEPDALGADRQLIGESLLAWLDHPTTPDVDASQIRTFATQLVGETGTNQHVGVVSPDGN